MSHTMKNDGGAALEAVIKKLDEQQGQTWATVYWDDLKAIIDLAVNKKYLRDKFAGQALVGLVQLIGIPEDGPDDLWDGSIAERAYAIADAMIKARGNDA